MSSIELKEKLPYHEQLRKIRQVNIIILLLICYNSSSNLLSSLHYLFHIALLTECYAGYSIVVHRRTDTISLSVHSTSITTKLTVSHSVIDRFLLNHLAGDKLN